MGLNDEYRTALAVGVDILHLPLSGQKLSAHIYGAKCFPYKLPPLGPLIVLKHLNSWLEEIVLIEKIFDREVKADQPMPPIKNLFHMGGVRDWTIKSMGAI